MKINRTAVCAVTFVLTLHLMNVKVLAGDINEYETQLMKVLSSTFEYEGIQYKAEDIYLQMAREYLTSDEIDLTYEQYVKAVSMVNSNIETAILSGYIKPVTSDEIIVPPVLSPTAEPMQEEKPPESLVVEPTPEKKPTESLAAEPTQDTGISDEIIKNAGYNLEHTILFFFGMAMVYILIIILYNHLAHKHES